MNKSEIKVISVLERVGGFASAQQLHQLLLRSGESIGLTSVYRALQSLVDDKIVDQLRKDDGEAIYRLCGEAHHHHLVCKSCGSTVEIEVLLLKSGPRLWPKNMVIEKLAISPKFLESVLVAEYGRYPRLAHSNLSLLCI
jgi:Fur family ferric uptake transcriptional regulator